MIVHTVFSLFPDRYSDSFLFAVNIVFLLAACVLLFITVKRFWGNTLPAFMAVVMYGFSCGFSSCAVFFRMYAMETFWVILTLYTHLCFRDDDSALKGKNRVFLMLPVMFGFWTHYYYVLYILPLFVVTCLYLLRRDQKVKMVSYIKTMVLAGIINLICWPFSAYHILFGYRGTEAMANLALHGTVKKISSGLKLLFHMVFLDRAFLLLLFLLIIVVGLLLKRKSNTSAKIEYIFGENWTFVCIPAIVYGLVVFKVAPSVTDRYIMCLLPLIYMFMAVCMYVCIENIFLVFEFKNKTKVEYLILCCIGIGYAVLSCTLVQPGYLYLEQKDKVLGIDEDKSQINCLMIGDDDYYGFPEAVKLSEFEQVMVIGDNDIGRLCESKPKDKDSGMVIYVLEKLDQDAVLTDVINALSLPESVGKTEITSDIGSFNAYYFPNLSLDTSAKFLYN